MQGAARHWRRRAARDRPQPLRNPAGQAFNIGFKLCKLESAEANIAADKTRPGRGVAVEAGGQ